MKQTSTTVTRNPKKNTVLFLAFLAFSVLMLSLGSNDALRGIFAPIFKERYALSEFQNSRIIMFSYIGNLVFLLLGGRLLDRFSPKRVFFGILFLWLLGAGINFVTDSYGILLITIPIMLGASTLLNTSVNLFTPRLFPLYSGLMVNLFFFIQGIGTSGSQLLLGRALFSFQGWRLSNLLLILLGGLAAGLTVFVPLKNATVDEASPEASARIQTEKKEAGLTLFLLFSVMMGMYFIAEHGIMNWLLSYCMNAFSMDSGSASLYLSMFWGGMTAGRLLFAPVVQKLRPMKSLLLFGGIGSLLFTAGVLLGRAGLPLLGLSGLSVSILYPTMVLLLQTIYAGNKTATYTTWVISLASIADILFNGAFGALIDKAGFRIGFLILPAAILLFYGLLLLIRQQVKSNKTEL